MKVFFIGPAGSGKGTHAKLASKETALPHISTGDLLRNLQGELKKTADEIMESGKLFPDELMAQILKQRLEQDDCANGFILDGFPRNVEQARELLKITDIDKVIEMNVPDEEVIERLSNRLTCKGCGEIYNKKNKKPKQENKCDECDGELYARADDNEDAIAQRLKLYHEETKPILEMFEADIINAVGSIEDVNKRVLEAFGIGG